MDLRALEGCGGTNSSPDANQGPNSIQSAPTAGLCRPHTRTVAHSLRPRLTRTATRQLSRRGSRAPRSRTRRQGSQGPGTHQALSLTVRTGREPPAGEVPRSGLGEAESPQALSRGIWARAPQNITCSPPTEASVARAFLGLSRSPLPAGWGRA